jgi:hypothetical protein
MPKTTLRLAMLATMLVPVLYAVPAQAQEPPPPRRVFVAAQGSDSNPCTFAAPCLTFNQANSVVAAGGEIDVLDPAGYGSISISKAVSVQGHGFASIAPAASSAAGIFIQAGPNEKVNLNGLIIDGAGFGATGIVFASGGSLVIENSVVRNWNSSGIAIGPTNSASINISNTLVADNGGHGIYIQPAQASDASVIGTFSRVEVHNNAQKGIGIFANLGGVILATVVDSVAAHNETNFYALGSSDCDHGITAFMQVIRSASTQGLNAGIRAEDHAQIAVGQSSLLSFFTGGEWSVSTCGRVVSFGDNDAFDPAPSGTIPKF